MLEGRKHGEIWALDEQMRVVANELVQEFTDMLGHIRLEHVVFVRVSDAPSHFKWLGKCYHVKEPHSLMLLAFLEWLKIQGVVGKTDIAIVQDMITTRQIDVRYIIALNDDALSEVGLDDDESRRVVIHHELLHIKDEMDGIVDHNVQDFRAILTQYGVNWDLKKFSLDADDSDGETS